MRDTRTFFAVPYRLDGSLRYFVWYADEQDGVLSAAPGRLATFRDLPAVDAFLSQQGLVLEPDRINTFDFDQLAAWLIQPSPGSLDCETTLNAWNMFGDISRSFSLPVCGAMDSVSVYHKLFWGSNIPAVTPAGHQFKPDWSTDEITALVRVLSSGLANVREVARYAG